jgi:Family of unknown function (DUF6516)
MIGDNPLTSLANYSRFVVEVFNRPIALRSTVVVWSDSPYTGIAEGEVFSRWVSGYAYAKSWISTQEESPRMATKSIAGKNGSIGYDDFPHPNDPTLASTFPHHKHIPPDIKRNRLPAPEIRFTRPNLEVLLREIEGLL